MIISISILSSIFSYTEIVKNKVKKKRSELITSPLIFIFLLLGLWEAINLFTLDFYASYNLMFIFYVVSYSIIISFFLGLNVKFWIKNWLHWKEFLYNSPVLLICLFDVIFFLFYYQKELVQPDLLYWYGMINELHTLGHNSFSIQILQKYSAYLATGIYQYGASLNVFSKFYLFPYFQTYLFFYILTVSTYVIVDKYFSNHILKENIIFISICLVFTFFYIFYNFGNKYDGIEGDWISCSYILIFTLCYFSTINSIKNKYYFFLIPLTLLFINETVTALLPFLLLSMIPVTIIFRNKYKFSLIFEIILIIFFIFSIYITFTITFQYFSSEYTINKWLYFGISAITYFLILGFFLCFLLKIYYKNKNYKINQNFFIRWWSKNTINKLNVDNWFINKRSWTKFGVIVVTTFLLIISIFNIFSTQVWPPLIFAISLVFLICFIYADIKIIIQWRQDIYFYYFFIYLFVIFLFNLITFKTGITSFMTERLLYSGIMLNGNYMEGIKNIVLVSFMLMIAINSKVNHFKYNFNKSSKAKKIFTWLNVSTAIGVSCIPVPIYQYFFYEESFPSFKAPNNLFHFGFSKNTIDELNSMNFQNKLTFCDFYLPTVNSSSHFIQGWGNYNPYNDINITYITLLYDPYYDVNGNKLTNFNLTRYKESILPYYSYVVLQADDVKFVNLINSMQDQFHLIKNVNNKIYIYENMDVNADKQNSFIKYNSFVY